ncbi:MAG: nitroreductase family protein [Ketobacteraceae bacterium]|nr:nitroreductase family protein [Ketobacteraceae bacterium]
MSEDNFFDQRDPVPGVAEVLYKRWSPRAFAQATLSQQQMNRLIDAARWSPSCYNEQPWRFYTSTADTFSDFVNLLVEANQAWAKHASVLGFLAGRKHFRKNGKPNDSYQLDCGSAWMAMTIQARLDGLYTHGMAGIKKAEVAEYLGLDTEQEEVLMGFAIGMVGDKHQLSEAMQEKEYPSPREPLSVIWPKGNQAKTTR